MKCKACRKHFKPERTIEQDSVCPDCQPAGNTQLNALFEEILKRHVALVELRDIYRHKLDTILENAQKQAF